MPNGQCRPDQALVDSCAADWNECVKKCKSNDATACNTLGFIYGRKTREKLNAERACERGEASACTSLGSIYEEGKVVKLDLSRALDLYRRACDAGDQAGCVNLQRKR